MKVLLVLCALGCALALPLPVAKLHELNTADPTYIDAAIMAANWIVSQATETPDGLYWADDLIGQSTANVNRTYDLYSGISGTIIFLMEASLITGNQNYLVAASKGADYMVAKMDDHIMIPTADLSLYHGDSPTTPMQMQGLAGVGFALMEMYKSMGDEKYLTASLKMLDYIRSRGDKSGTGTRYCDNNGVRHGSAGVGFYFLYMREELSTTAHPDETLLDSAVEVGESLLSLGVKAEEGGTKWFYRGTDGPLAPNYSGGNSGIGDFFIVLYSLTQDSKFLDGALAAATYLHNVAILDNGACMIFHSSMNPTMFYLSECNGPAGTGRYWQRMFDVTQNTTFSTLAGMSAHAIQLYAIDRDFNFVFHFNQTDPFWSNIGQCDGSAGAGDFLLYLYKATGNEQYLSMTKVVADNIMSRASKANDVDMFWVTEEWRGNKASTAAQVGYMQGAAGVGSYLFGVHAADQKVADHRIRFPDYPGRFIKVQGR